VPTHTLTARMTATAKINLLGLDRRALGDFFVGIGEKPFRAHQVMQWLHHYGVQDFAAMTNVGKELRAA